MKLETYLAGRLDPQVNERLLTAILATPTIELKNDIALKGTNEFAPGSDEELSALNASHIYHGESEELTKAYLDVAADLRQIITDAIPAPCDFINIRSWQTKSGSNTGPDKWHRDGLGENIFKLMVYSTETQNGGGGFEIIVGSATDLLSGPAGMWVLFKNSEFKHRGVPPDPGKPNRIATEFTLQLCS